MGKSLVDVAEIKIKAGNGGDGNVSFRHAKYIAKGGPDGGNGGHGGSVYFKVNPNMATLMDFRSHSFFKAENGQRGGNKNKTGASGADLYVDVPVGTLVYKLEGEREVLLADMVDPGQTLLVSKGGKGGAGNTQFKSSTNQTPRQYTEGEKTEIIDLKLEVKLVADVGLIGLPNAGKSTLLNSLTNSKAQVGEFPFTTLSPNLGVMTIDDNKIILADIPGLIEGASEGKGLGDDFLRHIERTRILVHVIDPLQGEDIEDVVANAVKNYEVIRAELKEYSAELEDKVEIPVINKIDMIEVSEKLEKVQEALKKKGINVIGISGYTGKGLDKLANIIVNKLSEIPKKPLVTEERPVKVYTIDNLPNNRMIFKKSRVLEKKGRK